MNAKKVGALAAGAAFFLLGCAFVLSGTWNLLQHWAEPWMAGDSLAVVAVGSYFIWCGVRLSLWANQRWDRAKARVKWGPVCLGALILHSQIKQHFHPTPTPDALKPSNETQAQAMAATSIIFAFVGAALILWGAFSKTRKPAPHAGRVEA